MLLLSGAALFSAQDASMKCSNIAATLTGAVYGPGSFSALIGIYRAVDHALNSQDCLADYHLLILHPIGDTTVL